MTRGTERRLQRIEDQVAGIGPGCRVCRPLGDTQITDDHGFVSLPAACPSCGREVAGEARVEIHVVTADAGLLLGLKGAPTDATA